MSINVENIKSYFKKTKVSWIDFEQKQIAVLLIVIILINTETSNITCKKLP